MGRGLYGAAALIVAGVVACGRTAERAPAAAADEETMAKKLEAMVDRDVAARGVTDPATLAAMRAVPRWEFVPAELRARAFEDNPLPIGEGQTISQPYIVAYMTEALRLAPTDRVLEVGTGSGYQAAVLACLAAEVYTVEIVPALGERAAATLSRLGYDNVRVRVGDGYQGWPEAAPFDAIIVTCAADHVPEPLFAQLRDGGRLVIPISNGYPQLLKRYTKHGDTFETEDLQPVLFVPMTGRVEEE